MIPGFYVVGNTLVLIGRHNGRVEYYDDFIGIWLSIRLPETWELELVEAFV